jgi:DNA repair exonuclease SbcCD ATPase subunit
MAEVTQKVIEIKAKIEGEKTVKQLKDQIAELTHLMDTLDTESLEYHRTVDMLVDAQEELNTVMKAGKSQLSAQEGSYNALVNRMAALKKAQKAVTDEASRMRLGEEIRKINDQLKEIDANNGVYVRNVGNYENAIKSALKTPQQELKALRQQLAQLTEGTAEYNAVFARMADLTHKVTEQQEMLKWSSADLGDILGNLAGVATSVAGGFSAFNALGGLLGMGENEDMEKAMLQAQRFIQLIQGLEQLEQLADKIRGLWKGIENFANSTTVGTAALADFQQETEKVQAASTGAASAINTNAAATNTGAEATRNMAAAQRELNEVENSYVALADKRIEELEKIIPLRAEGIRQLRELIALKETDDSVSEESLDSLKETLRQMEQLQKVQEHSLKERKKEVEVIRNGNATVEKSIVNGKARYKVIRDTTAATNAQSAANVAAAGTTTLWAKALGILKTALISTGIGAIIVALGALLNLLGKGLSSLWGWISGADKAAERTENLKNAFEDLNMTMEKEDRLLDHKIKYLEATGASYDEMYEAQKKCLDTKLAETRALLASQKAIAADIGYRKLQKKKYDEFRETLAELEQQELDLIKAVGELNYDKYIEGVKQRKKAEDEAAAARKKAADEAAAAYKKEKETAEKLLKSLIDYYKDEKTKLKEKYEEEKKLLEKFGKDTTLLTKKYEEEKTAIVKKEEDVRRKAREQFNKDFDSTFRNPSVEYFNNELQKAAEKLTDFMEVYNTINRDADGTPAWAENFRENIEYLNETYKTNIESMKQFDLVFQKVMMEWEDAQKALKDYQKLIAQEKSDKRVAEIEKEITAIQNLMDWESQQYQNAYDLYMAENNYYTDFTNNYISQMYLRWDAEDAIYQQRMLRMQQEVDMYKAAAQDITLTEEARLEALAKANAIERQMAQESADYMIAANTRKVEATDNYMAAVQDSLSGISQILGDVASAWETSIQAQVDAGEISEEEGEKQMENMRGIQSAIALINALSSAVSAYNSMASIPYVGPALGAAAAAAALASGIAQVVAINKVKKGDKGGGDSTRYAEAIPTMPDYNPTSVTNITGGQETENLANAMTKSPIWVSVKDIDSAQSRVKTREKESTF